MIYDNIVLYDQKCCDVHNIYCVNAGTIYVFQDSKASLLFIKNVIVGTSEIFRFRNKQQYVNVSGWRKNIVILIIIMEDCVSM